MVQHRTSKDATAVAAGRDCRKTLKALNRGKKPNPKLPYEKRYKHIASQFSPLLPDAYRASATTSWDQPRVSEDC